MDALELTGLIVTSITTIVSGGYNYLQHKTKRALQGEKVKTEDEKKDLEAKLPKELVYTLVVDGAPNSGKSSLIFRLMSPGGDISKLQKTEKGWATIAWPVIWKKNTAKRELFCIKAQDIADETPQAVADLADEVNQQQGIVIIVIDANAVDTALSKFTKAYIKAVFSPKKIVERVKAAIIFVNKLDLIKENSRSAWMQETTVRLKDMVSVLNQQYPGTTVLFGSALTQENLFSLVAEIHRRMGISEHFETHPSALNV